MMTGCLSALVVMAVWTRTLAVSFERTMDSHQPDWSRIVVPYAGTYIVSATVDPDPNPNIEDQLQVKRNDQLIFTATATKIMSSTAMALQLNANDVITATGNGIKPGESNRLAVAYTSTGGEYNTSKTDRSMEVDYLHTMPFNKVWNSPEGGWNTHSQGYIEVAQRGIYWVMARLKMMFPFHAKMAVTFRHPATGNTYSVMIITTVNGYSVSCSGAFFMYAGQRAMLTGRMSDSSRIEGGTLLSAAHLTGNEQIAFTAHPGLQSQQVCQLCSSRRSTQSARRGHHDNLLREPDALRRTLRQVLLIDHDSTVLYWRMGIPTDYGGMGLEGGNSLYIPTTGIYLVGMRPDISDDNTRLGFVLYWRDRPVWTTWSEGTGSGETFAWRFVENDLVHFRATGSCRVDADSLISVAFLSW